MRRDRYRERERERDKAGEKRSTDEQIDQQTNRQNQVEIASSYCNELDQEFSLWAERKRGNEALQGMDMKVCVCVCVCVAEKRTVQLKVSTGQDK